MITNFTYCHVDIPDYQKFSQEIFKRVPKSFYEKKHGFWMLPNILFQVIPGFKAAIEKFGKWENLEQIALIVNHPNRTLEEFPIHQDLANLAPLALNLPVYNCDDTNIYTGFYKPIRELDKSEITHGSTTDAKLYAVYPEHLMKEVDRYYLTKPVIMNTLYPHTVVNPTNHLRLGLTIRWVDDCLEEWLKNNGYQFDKIVNHK
jgi:hypothetical protein